MPSWQDMTNEQKNFSAAPLHLAHNSAIILTNLATLPFTLGIGRSSILLVGRSTSECLWSSLLHRWPRAHDMETSKGSNAAASPTQASRPSRRTLQAFCEKQTASGAGTSYPAMIPSTLMWLASEIPSQPDIGETLWSDNDHSPIQPGATSWITFRLGSESSWSMASIYGLLFLRSVAVHMTKMLSTG
jgi:hypothetical protein